MTKQIVTIDINQLNTDQLEQLREMAYNTLRDMELVKQINDRLDFMNS